jgi:hypothetical protein
MKTNKNRTMQKKRVNRKPKRANTRNTTAGVLGMPTAWPGSSAVNPGRAYARMVTEVFSSDDSRPLSRTGFETWSSQIAGILSPYRYFRIVEATAEVVIAGGAASQYSCAFNISNSSSSDSGVVPVLNDDYAAVATAILRPKLKTPKSYWANRPVEWYTYSSSTDINLSNAGAISLSGSGGASASTVIGYLVAELVLEFHTLF